MAGKPILLMLAKTSLMLVMITMLMQVATHAMPISGQLVEGVGKATRSLESGM